MRQSPSALKRFGLVTVFVATVAAFLVLTHRAERLATAEDTPAADSDKPNPTGEPTKMHELGDPLVDDMKSLKQLGKYKAWLDAKGKQVVVLGESCKADYPIEFLITDRTRGYESIIVIEGHKTSPTAPSIYAQIHTALLLLGAKPGSPAHYDNEKNVMNPATGDPLSIRVRWKNKEGKQEECPAQDWIRDIASHKPLDANWVFGGSGFDDDGEGHQYYKADAGDFICVLSSPVGMIDLPAATSRALEGRPYEAFAEHLPPPGTPVTILIKPLAKEEPAKKK